MSTSETLKLANRMRETGCVEPSKLHRSAHEEGGYERGTVLYREAMIHAGGIVKQGGALFLICPYCEEVLPKSTGENNDRPTVNRDSA